MNEILTKPEGKHPVYEYLANLSEGSRGGATSKLRKAVSIWSDRNIEDVEGRDLYYFPWHRIDHTAMVNLKAQLEQENLSVSYTNTIFAHISGVLEEAVFLENGAFKDFDADDRAKALRKIRIKGSGGDTSGRALSQGEVNALIDACARDNSPAGFRDGAIISVSFYG